MALRKRTSRRTKSKRDPITKYAQQVTAFMTDDLGIDDVETIGKVCQMMVDAIAVQTGEVDEEEVEEKPAVRKSSRKRRQSGKRGGRKQKSKTQPSIGRVSLWENSGTGSFEFNGNIKFRFDGEAIEDDDDVDVEVSVLLFEPQEDASYLYSGILTEVQENTGKRRKGKSKKSPVVGRIYVYEAGAAARKQGMEAYAYLYLIDPDDDGDNVDPDYLPDYMPEEMVPEEGAFAKLLIYENDSDNARAPLFVGKVTLPDELKTDDDDDEEEDAEEEAPRRRNSRRKNTRRRKATATTESGRRRKGRSTRKKKSVNVLDFSATDMPDVYGDEDEEDEDDYE